MIKNTHRMAASEAEAFLTTLLVERKVLWKTIETAGASDEIALKVWDYVRRGDLVYREVETGP